ncbi:MAG TPA: palindromic element RPE5 domain-containing protein [Rickettsia endosymbiont of Omalisus fontisbellaquei]|nr:palindromic element RPE5 domain-containing protein [Rickettsia endosymbiont of Omalisus fontisbellaquei]
MTGFRSAWRSFFFLFRKRYTKFNLEQSEESTRRGAERIIIREHRRTC